MDGNYQNTNPTSVDNQNDAEEIVNNDAVPQDAKLVQLEILKMKEARQKSLENTAKLQQKLDEEQKAVQEKRTAKILLQQEIVELQCKLNDEKYENNTMRTDIGKMREMSKEIGKFCVRNEQTLQQCSQDKTKTIEKNKKLRTQICDNLAKLEKVLNKKQTDVTLMKETILSQQEVHEDCLEKREAECLEVKEKLQVSNTQLESLKIQSDELLQVNNSCLNNISDTEKNNKQLEEIWHCKHQHSNELLVQMEKDLQAFEQRKEEISNSLNEARFTLQKKETEIEGVRRGIKNQTEYNKNVRQKLAAKVKEIADLRQQNDQLEAEQKEKQVQLASSELGLTAVLNSRLEEEQNAQALLSAERQILNETEEQIKEGKRLNEELVRHIETQENIVAELKNKQNNQLQAITAFEQELLPLHLKLNNLKEELSEWQMKFAQYECNMLEEMSNKTAAAKAIVIEAEEMKMEEEARVRTIVQEMDSIKIIFDAETAQETGDFEEKQKQLQQQILMIEKELAYTRNLQVQLDEELQQLNKNCEKISKKIGDQESLNRAFSNISAAAVDFEVPALPLRPPSSKVGSGLRSGSSSTVSRAVRTGSASTVSYTAATDSTSPGGYASIPSTSTLILPPTGPVKPRAFDELSGSSAEGNVATYQQILEYKREKQRHRQLREQQRLRSRNSSTSQSNTAPGK